jgi:hypothetical protein
MSGDVWGVLIYHQWSLGADLEPPVINFFPKKNMFSRTSGNVLISILALSDFQTEPSGAHLGSFSFSYIFFLFNRHKPASPLLGVLAFWHKPASPLLVHFAVHVNHRQLRSWDLNRPR